MEVFAGRPYSPCGYYRRVFSACLRGISIAYAESMWKLWDGVGDGVGPAIVTINRRGQQKADSLESDGAMIRFNIMKIFAGPNGSGKSI